MPSEKMLAQRALESQHFPKQWVVKAGPGYVLAQGAPVTSGNRKARLKREAELKRAQRDEMRAKRRVRKWDGIEPGPPSWIEDADRKLADAQREIEKSADGKLRQTVYASQEEAEQQVSVFFDDDEHRKGRPPLCF